MPSPDTWVPFVGKMHGNLLDTWVPLPAEWVRDLPDI